MLNEHRPLNAIEAMTVFLACAAPFLLVAYLGGVFAPPPERPVIVYENLLAAKEAVRQIENERKRYE